MSAQPNPLDEHAPRARGRTLCLALAGVTLGVLLGDCNSTELPRTSFRASEIMAYNQTCSSGQCEDLVVVAVVPGDSAATGRNYFVIGELVPGGPLCLPLPDSVTVAGVHWTLASPMSLTALPKTTAPFTQTLNIGSTSAFVPGTRPLWIVTFPGAILSPSSDTSCIVFAARRGA